MQGDVKIVIAPTLKWSQSRTVTKIKITNTNEAPQLVPALFLSPPSTAPEESGGLQVWWNPQGTFKEFEVLFESLFADSENGLNCLFNTKKCQVSIEVRHQQLKVLLTRSKKMKRVQNAGPSLQPTVCILCLRASTLIVKVGTKEVTHLIICLFFLK